MSDVLVMTPFAHPATGAVRVPGSKSITNRALILAALAASPGEAEPAQSNLESALRSEDTEIMVRCLQALGIKVQPDWGRSRIEIGGCGGRFPTASAELFVGNSGTTMRFLTAVLSLGHGRYLLDGSHRMRQRPIGDLLDALQQLGVRAKSLGHDGCPPVMMEANGLHGGHVHIRGAVSSQFLSGLLLAAPLADADILLEVQGELVSQPYIAMTCRMMEQFGARLSASDQCFRVPGRQTYRPQNYRIEPDASAASYFFAAAAITGGRVTVADLERGSLQGDIRFVDVLAEMGAEVETDRDGVTVTGRPSRGVDVDMNDISDCVPTLAAVACFAEGRTTIRNVAHVRHKESDRLHALAVELRRVGAAISETEDGLSIEPRPLHGGEIETYDDHRMAMAMALIGLRVPGIRIRNPGCAAKTYPAFFADLERLRR